MEQKLLEIFSTIFNQSFNNPEEITKNNVENWDSLKHIELVMLLEEEFEVSFSPDDIPGLDTYAKIIDKIKEIK